MVGPDQTKAMEMSSGKVESQRDSKFPLPVDSEHKSTVFRVYSFSKPHMRAFHLSWITYFASFISTFAAPPLVPVIRDNLGLTTTDIGNARIASVSGAVFARVAMGVACDLFGPRLASASLILLTAPAVFCFAVAQDAISFLLVRFFTGFSLATFVSTQFWMSSMFSTTKVGTANAVAAGWGNVGGGATQLIMPLVYALIRDMGAVKFTAWRIAFFIPALFQTSIAFAIMFLGQDLPDGSFRKVRKSGDKPKDKLSKVFYHAVTNYRVWIVALTYGYCFGVELTIDNIIAEYFYDRFDLNLHTAGLVAASFGLANIVTRPGGGMFSDAMGRRFGMRGRLWALWGGQTLGGILCIILGSVSSLWASIFVMILFSVFVQASCGTTYGVVPFISHRSLGVTTGMVGAGGNTGAVLTQLIFFQGSRYSKETGIKLMGVMIVACTAPLMLLYFPQWGGMFCGPSSKKKVTEEEYYRAEWTEDEQSKGYHQSSMKFADNSRSEQGRRTEPVAASVEEHF